ncbi:hypothetical protein [Oligoflexus tunisiensis]|uniref:hypothetical protein n=1 Tax=Oligoflexus tunisiensis TaxID=708132 RepID=UPI000ACB237B|nr:hypothetical protein [Oligoflexus tunisiensis]
MLYPATTVTGLGIQAIDGLFGAVSDLYFDDVTWIVRYLVVDTGSWLSGRKVLISPEALTGIHRDANVLTTTLTQQQIKDSPPSDSEKTVSRQHEECLSEYYGWSPYWLTPSSVYRWPNIYPHSSLPPDGTLPSGIGKEARARVDAKRSEEIHLRSFKEIKGYGIGATDGNIGELDDLLFGSHDWRITHLIADSRKWWPGGQVILDRSMVDDIVWADRKIQVAMTQDEVRQAPPYDPDRILTDQYQKEVSKYYQKLATPKTQPPSARSRNALSEHHPI